MNNEQLQLWNEFLKDHPYINKDSFNKDHAMGASFMLVWLREKHLDILVSKYTVEFEAHDKTASLAQKLFDIARYGVNLTESNKKAKCIKALTKVMEKLRENHNG